MRRPAKRITRTEDRPVEKEAQWMLTRLNPWLDWSRLTSADSLDSLFSMWSVESSDMLMAGAGVDEVACLARYSLTSISFRYSSIRDCAAEMRKGAILKSKNEVGENPMCEAQ